MNKYFKFFLFLLIIWNYPTIYAEEIVLDSGSIQWIFESEHGLLKEIRSFDSPKKNFVFDPPCSLWELKGNDLLLNAEGKNILFSFSSENNFKTFRWMLIPDNKNKDNAPWEVSLQMKYTDGYTLELLFTCKTTQSLFDELTLPKINNVSMGPDAYLVIPYWMGEIYDSRVYRDRNKGFKGERRWEYPGTLSMQWIGIYNSSDLGLCLWTKDTQQNFKSAYIHGDSEKGGMGWTHLFQEDKDGEHHLSYPVCITAVQGNWYNMALLYRQWARKQIWAEESRKKQKQTAPWVEDTALWVWNRMESEKVLWPAMDLAKRLQLPVSVLWHWWHGCAYDIGFPEYLPPREGNVSFTTALENANKEGVHALIYVNQRLWGTNTRSWKEQEAERYAVINKDGHIHPEVYNIFQPFPCVPMCMGTEFWHKTLLDIMVPTWQDTVVAGFYLDQACASLPCFATSHGHIPGAKDFWMKGFQQLTSQLRTECKPRNSETVVLAGEGCGEAWLPYLDLFLSLQVSKGRYSGGDGWRPVPLFQAVYHPISIQFGNYASLTEPPYDTLWPKEFAPSEPLRTLDKKWNTQFRYEQACAFVWGQQPMIANYKKELWNERKEELEFVLKLATLRYKFRDYFLQGELLKPLPEEMTDNWDEICLSVYAYRKEGGKIFNRCGNLLLTMPWRTDSGKTALAVANADDKERLLEFTISSKDWMLPDEGKIIKHDVNNSVIAGSFSKGMIHFSQVIGKQDAALFEFQ
ncbi:MAG TPA: DUF6259 domain-containing protein [Candidatus Hydrogenedens sp.]|nr:DUF6259 domain-containing protein [Candidatus Hydrogenedens sp.]